MTQILAEELTRDSLPQPTIVFDVDGTLIDLFDQPRWEVIDMLRAFYAIGYRIFVWSGGGKGYADMVVRRLGLSSFVEETYAKSMDIHVDLAVDDVADADFGPNIPVIKV